MLSVGSFLADENAAADGSFWPSLLYSVHGKFLNELFDICESVVELNLNSVHFSDEIDCCCIVAGTLPQLKALAVPRCALNRPLSFSVLASSCRLLEEVDVRVKLGCTTAECDGCVAPLDIEGGLAEQMRKVKLRRFTLWNVECPAPEKFLRNLGVSELRVSIPRTFSRRGVGGMLADNERLQFFVYEDRYLNLGSAVFLKEVTRLKNVRYLCLITHLRTRETVVYALLMRLQRHLLKLRTVHLHYSDDDRTIRRVTWIRLTPGEPTSSRGIVLRERPCVLCSTSTFIGLIKPRNGCTNGL